MSRRHGGRGYAGRSNPRPIAPVFWLLLFAIPGLVIWRLGGPLFPLPWIGMLVAGASAKYPVAPSGRKTDPPDPKDIARYHKWKDTLAGLKPSKDWLAVRRVSWWMAWGVGLFAAGTGLSAWSLLDIPFGFMACMGVVRMLDRRVDRRHVYKGVSIPAFMTKADAWKRLLAAGAPLLLLIVFILLFALGFTSLPTALGLPTIVFGLLVTLFDRNRQSEYWRDLVKWQRTIDEWASGDDLKKAWGGAYVTQVSHVGAKDNPLTVLRVRMQDESGKRRGNQPVFKLGVEAIKAPAAESGYNFVSLLAAKQKKKGEARFDPSSVRVAIGSDESCLPDIRDRAAGEGVASLVADIAYAKTAIAWHKRAPLTEAHDVSADESKAAWLLEIILPPEGGDPMGKISFDWLDGEEGPASTLRMPVFADMYDGFHLVAFPDTPLSDKGNKWRAKGKVTRDKDFQGYIDKSRRFKAEQSIWQSIIGQRMTAPVPMYDNEESEACDGYTVTTMPLTFTPPYTAADYARFDLSPLSPTAKFVGVTGNGQEGMLVVANGGAPSRIDRITGRTPFRVAYARALVYKALLDVLPSKADVTIESCMQEGEDIAIWKSRFRLDGGASVADIRRKSANFASSVGAAHVLWDWRSADMATIWMCGEDMPLSPDDLPHWRRKSSQKPFLRLALSDSWGVAGVSDPSGRTPEVVSLGVLPRNNSVLLARFRVPGGISIDRPDNNLGKFLTAADYGYGRVLPRGDEHGSDMFDMVLSKQSPFPTSVDADWEYARSRDAWTFPLGVDDMGNPVEWNTKATPHVLVCGKSGTGKSSAAQVLVAEALLKGYDIILVDPSKGCIDFTQWAKPKAIAFVGEGQLRETTAVIGWLRHEMSIRVRLNTKYGVGNFNDVDISRVDPEDRGHYRRIILFFDEFNSYLTEMGRTQSNPNRDVHVDNDNAAIAATNAGITKAMSDLAKIAVQGRTAGIDLILGAQRLTMDDMKRFNGNAFFRTLGRILLGSDSPAGVFSQGNLRAANRLQSGLKGAGGTIPRGRGMYESADGTLSAVQTWWSGGQPELAELVAGIPDGTPIDYAPFMPVEAEQFGEMSDEELQRALTEQASTTDGEELSGEELSDIERSNDADDIDDIDDVDW